MDSANDDLRLLADAARQFARAHAATGQAAGNTTTWAAMHDVGFAGAGLTEAHGGSGLGANGVAVIAEALGSTAVPVHYAVDGVFLPVLFAQTGLDDLLAKTLEGRLRLAVDAGLLDGQGEQQGEHRMAFGPSGAEALLSLQFTEKKPVLMLSCGFFTEKRTLDGRTVMSVGKRDSQGHALVQGEQLRGAIAAAKTRALAAAAADSLGAMNVLFTQTLDYMRIRRQFGQSLSSFQTIQFRLVDMSIRLEEARSLSAAAADAIDEDDPDAGRLARAAWVQALWSGQDIAQEAVQLHGGIGMTAASGIAPLVKRLLVSEFIFGQAEEHMADYRALSA